MPRLTPPELGNGWRPSDERHGQGSVPILDINDDSHEAVGQAHYAASDPYDETPLLNGAVVQFDHAEGPATVYIGGSTLFEAATEVVTCVTEMGTDAPTWVASTDPDLAGILAEHFTVENALAKWRNNTCEVIDLDEVTV